MAKKRSFSDVFSKYKTYDPAKEGYGSVKDWRGSFKETMGVGEAATALGDDSPLTILGLTAMPTYDELKKLYRKLMKVHHPDAGGDAERAKLIIAAYTVLESQLNAQ